VPRSRARAASWTARIRERAPQLADLESGSASSLGEVRASLPAGTALVSYMVMDDGIEIFVVPPGRSGASISSVRVPIRAGDLRVLVDRLAFLLSTPADAPDAREALRAASERLYALLIAPVESKLRRQPEWIVVPDGPLHRLPFAALIERSAQDGARPRYLVESHVLTTVVSATVYGQLRRRAARPASLAGLVAFGDPQIAADARLITRAPLGDTLRGELLRPLPWARVEVEEIGRVVGGAEIYVGAEATEARVRTVAPRAAALHFASHGVLDEQSPLDSFLLLAAPAAGGGPANDGRLTAREVLDLPPLSAQLVTLSACSTSASADSDGEGLMGLTRAFQANGANAVVSSLWKVSDRSTSELMLEFYRHWPRATAAQALAAAQRRYVDRHPFYWAAFEVSGAQRIR
jgi:CHAT domain-containing protein